MKTYIISLFLFLLVSGCDGNAEQSAESIRMDQSGNAMDEAEREEYSKSAEPVSEHKVMSQKLIKNGALRFETDDLTVTRKKIMEAVQEYEGYISDESGNSDLNQITESITVRVSSDHFDELLNSIMRGVEYVDYKSVNVQDVTEQFVDLSSRIKSKKEIELRYIELLSKAKNVEELLVIERELGTIRTDIEAMTGRLRYLENQTSYSTLSISYYKVISNPVDFGSKAVQSFASGWDRIRSFFLAMIAIWPFLLLFGIPALLGYRKLRTHRSGVK